MNRRTIHDSACRRPPSNSPLFPNSLTALAVSLLLAFGVPPQPAHAQEAAVQVGIAAQPLASALVQLANAYSLELAYAPDIVAGLDAPGISGNLTADQALQGLLRGTGIEFKRNGRNVSLSRPASPATQLPAVQVTGAAIESGPPPAYAGGQVALRGGRVGLLGDKDFLDTPFSATQYTSKLIEDQQAQNIGDVLVNDPAVRNTYSRGAGRDEFNIRGFTLFNYDVSYNGLYGVSPRNASS